MVCHRRISVVLFGMIAAALPAGCQQQTPLAADASDCPNALPRAGDPCPRPGMVCNYFTGCRQYYPASCQANGTWQVQNGCVLPGSGAGGAGGGGGGAGGH